MIDMKLVRTNVYTRWPCDVCGGCTEKVEFLCEGRDTDSGDIRVCERCLEAGQDCIDAILQEHIERRKSGTLWLRGLIGRLKVPAFSEWLIAEGIKPKTPYPWEMFIPGGAAGGHIAVERYPIDDDIPF